MRSHGILTLLVCIVAVLAVAGAGCTGTTQAGGDELKDSYMLTKTATPRDSMSIP